MSHDQGAIGAPVNLFLVSLNKDGQVSLELIYVVFKYVFFQEKAKGEFIFDAKNISASAFLATAQVLKSIH